MKILVTGAAGFIGCHLVRALLRAGHAVRALDNLSTGRWERLRDLVGKIEWMEADIADFGAAMRAAQGVEAVLHEAALPSISRSLLDPIAVNAANVDGTVAMLQACREAGVRRLIYAGSSSVYGEDSALPRLETMCPSPRNPYAAGKLAAEQYCRVFARLGYVETVCLRYFNVFGPLQAPDTPYAAVIPKFLHALRRGQPVTVYGDGTQSRDFTYVENVAQANLLALHAPGVSGEVFNIGCGQRHDLNHLIRRLGELLGVEPRVERCPARPGEIAHSLACIQKARGRLGYAPKVDFEEGLRRTVAWFLAGRERLSEEAGEGGA